MNAMMCNVNIYCVAHHCIIVIFGCGCSASVCEGVGLFSA
ncbi:putative membrane protein [Bifidobacterium animalis subsp. lactis CECT 8145]|nr:hypothetical protein BAA6_0489 [Bifidobacterium animalis]QIR80518.1 hypothetical protein M8PIadj_0500 [Bifidobacterium animalis]CDL71892.1 putative membrane protein [Bifidobacterium animalis subsp. lactis CECT 8145]